MLETASFTFSFCHRFKKILQGALRYFKGALLHFVTIATIATIATVATEDFRYFQNKFVSRQARPSLAMCGQLSCVGGAMRNRQRSSENNVRFFDLAQELPNSLLSVEEV